MNSYAEKLLASYNYQIIWGNVDDPKEAIQYAIDAHFPFVKEEERADLYASLAEEWDSYPAGFARKLFVSNTINNWNHRRIHGIVHRTQGSGTPEGAEEVPPESA